MPPVLRELLSSKKFLALIGGGIVWIAAAAGFQVDQEQLDKFLVLLGVYMGAQGLADLGSGIGNGRKPLGELGRPPLPVAPSSSDASLPPASATDASLGSSATPDPMAMLALLAKLDGRGGLGLAVHDEIRSVIGRREEVRVIDRKPEAGTLSAALAVILCAIAAIALLFSSASCGGAVQRLGRIGGALLDGVMDCTTAEAKELIRNAGKPTDLSLIGVPDLKTGMSELAKDSAADIFGCLLADATTRALKPKPTDPRSPRSSPLDVDPTKLEEAWAATKASRFPGVRTFRTANGDI